MYLFDSFKMVSKCVISSITVNSYITVVNIKQKPFFIPFNVISWFS